MSEQQFKPGDRVRVRADAYGYALAVPGSVGVVTDRLSDGWPGGKGVWVEFESFGPGSEHIEGDGRTLEVFRHSLEREQPHTVKVRIAVAVDAQGDWEALGSSSEGDADIAERVALNHGDEHSRMEDAAPPAIVWVEASVPLPRAVEGRVEA